MFVGGSRKELGEAWPLMTRMGTDGEMNEVSRCAFAEREAMGSECSRA